MKGPWEDPRVAEGLSRQFDARRQALAEGAAHVGWKVGFGAPAAREKMDIGAPLMGYLTDRTVLASGASVVTAGWSGGVVEFEVVAYMATDLGSGATHEQASAAVGALGPSIELADIDLPLEADRVADIVGGNIFHAGVVFGDRDPQRAGIDLAGLTARILVDGIEVAFVTELEEQTGPYPEVVATVANTLAANGELLRAGDLIITGSVVPPIRLDSGSEFSFHLASFDPITVRIEA